MKAIELNSSTFDQTLADATVPVLVDFHAEWCGPCKMLGPVIDQIAADKDGQAIVAKVDIDEARDIAQRFQITSVPSLIVFQNGEPVAATRGVQSKSAIEALIDQASDTLASA